MTSQLLEAAPHHTADIVKFLQAMSDELQEFDFDPQIVTNSVRDSFADHAHWFLFQDEHEQMFGTCYLQSVHNYWRMEKRYYLGGFYILPSHRGRGRFREINKALVKWANAQGGVQIYAHIHKDNEKSLKTFEAVGLEQVDYRLCVHHWGED